MKTVLDKFKNKKILIWGYGREGKSTEQFFLKLCDTAKVDVFEGKREDINEDEYDYIVKSPGIVMEEDHPKYTSQTDIFLEAYRDQVIGITGTKGKSTTSAMLYHVLNECLERKVILLGNIGKPCLDYFDEMDSDTVVVFEMSCHQLAHAMTSPHVSVFLNLFEEHLDYYKTFDKYFAAKAHITKWQKKGDYFYLGSNVPTIQTEATKIVIDRGEVADYALRINGLHNNYNAEFVYRIATERFNVDGQKVKESLKTFEGLAHRLQYIGTLNGVDYYDDSISTIPNATIEALSSIRNAATVLIGGMDRGISYDTLIDFINANSQFNYIFSYDSGKRIYDNIVKGSNCYYQETLADAVKLAKEITPEGKACILSPASASYGYFKNFEHRGEVFKELVGLA